MAVFDRLTGPRGGVAIGLSQILPLQNLSLVLPEPPVEPAQKRTDNETADCPGASCYSGVCRIPRGRRACLPSQPVQSLSLPRHVRPGDEQPGGKNRTDGQHIGTRL